MISTSFEKLGSCEVDFTSLYWLSKKEQKVHELTDEQLDQVHELLSPKKERMEQ